MTTNQKTHWDSVYSTAEENEVSWFQETPTVSLELLALVNAKPTDAIVDVGGGASRLVSSLLAEGFAHITVLDLSAAALAASRAHLGENEGKVTWIAADATEWEPPQVYDIWHDRAAFHFLTSEKDQQAYVKRLKRGLRVGGHFIAGTFALDGPEKCSGLPVARHNSETLSRLLGPQFSLVDSRRHDHVTPRGINQKFQFSTFRHGA